MRHNFDKKINYSLRKTRLGLASVAVSSLLLVTIDHQKVQASEVINVTETASVPIAEPVETIAVAPIEVGAELVDTSNQQETLDSAAVSELAISANEPVEVIHADSEVNTDTLPHEKEGQEVISDTNSQAEEASVPQVTTDNEAAMNTELQSLEVAPEAVVNKTTAEPEKALDTNDGSSTNNEVNAETTSVQETIKTRTTRSIAPDYHGTVEFYHENTLLNTVAYTDGDSVLTLQGAPADDGALVAKKYFVGWSDHADYRTNDTARIALATDRIAIAFPEGLSGVKQLYAIYISKEDLDAINIGNKVTINQGLTMNETMPGHIVKDGSLYASDNKVTYYYDATKNEVPINASAEFKLNKLVSLLTYLNPEGVLTNSDQLADGAKQGANYTHVDLHINFDPRIMIPGEMSLDFTSYNMKPSYILDANYNILKEINTADLTLNNPTTTISFDPKSNKTIIIRATVRNDLNEAYKITGTADDVLDTMKVTFTTPDQLKINNSVLKNIANPNETTIKKLEINGYMDGLVRTDSMNHSINKLDVEKPLIVDIAHNMVTFDYNEVSIQPDITDHLEYVMVGHNQSIDGDSLNTIGPPNWMTIGDDMPERYRGFWYQRVYYQFTHWNTKRDGTGEESLLVLANDSRIWSFH